MLAIDDDAVESTDGVAVRASSRASSLPQGRCQANVSRQTVGVSLLAIDDDAVVSPDGVAVPASSRASSLPQGRCQADVSRKTVGVSLLAINDDAVESTDGVAVRASSRASSLPQGRCQADVSRKTAGKRAPTGLRGSAPGSEGAGQVLNLRTRLSSSLESAARLLESSLAESESSAISCASPWIWLIWRLMSSAT